MSTVSISSQSVTVGSGYTIPILSLTNMKFPTIRSRHTAKFYERFISTQVSTYGDARHISGVMFTFDVMFVIRFVFDVIDVV